MLSAPDVVVCLRLGVVVEGGGGAPGLAGGGLEDVGFWGGVEGGGEGLVAVVLPCSPPSRPLGVVALGPRGRGALARLDHEVDVDDSVVDAQVRGVVRVVDAGTEEVRSHLRAGVRQVEVGGGGVDCGEGV